MEHYILANPYSGKKRGEKIATSVQKLLLKNSINAKVILSMYPKHLIKVAQELSKNGLCRFYVIGGDGTLNEVVSGVIGTDSEIVVIPGGTGNDFVKTVSKYMSMRKIVLNSIQRKSTSTDVIKVNNDKYCINILNTGFDALVAKNVDHFRNIPLISGKVKYDLAIFYTLLTNKNYHFKTRIDDIVSKKLYTLIVVANGKYYGGGIIPCPDANTTDGLLDICLIDSTSIINKLLFLPSYNKGKHLNNKKVNFNKSKKVHIVSNKEFPVSIDGEVFMTKKLNLSILEKKVNIVYT